MSEVAIALKKGFEKGHANATLIKHKLDTFKELCGYYGLEIIGGKQALLDQLSAKIPKKLKVSHCANVQKRTIVIMALRPKSPLQNQDRTQTMATKTPPRNGKLSSVANYLLLYIPI